MNVGEMVLHAARGIGVAEVFGIPGDFVLPLFQVIEQSAILPLYTLSHEPAVGFAADGAARWRCGPSLAVVTYGAGALNMVNPVAAAYAEKSPVIVVSGGPGIHEHRADLLLHHQAKRLDSQFSIYSEITCDQVRLDNPATAPDDVARVLASCLTHSRPVYIEIPRDQVFEPCLAAPPSVADESHDSDAVDACVEEVLDLLQDASSPVLLVGVEVRRFGLEHTVAAIARRFGLPVITSFMGRGLLADSEAPYLGTYLGVAGEPAITDLVEKSDALVLLGVILSDTNFGISKQRIDLRRCVQALDRRVSLGFHIYPDIPLSVFVQRLLECEVPQLKHAVTWTSLLPSARATPREPARMEHAVTSPDDAPIGPDDIAIELNAVVPQRAPFPLVADMGDCLFTAMAIEGTQLAAPGYYATMGFAVPAAFGVQVASGKRPVVLVGDGAFQMTGWELVNAQRYGWDPIVVVLNNAGWEMLRAFQPESRFNDLPEWNFSAIIRSLGGRGSQIRTRRQFREALEIALREPGVVHLLEVLLPRGVISTTMRRYVEGIARRGTPGAVHT